MYVCALRPRGEPLSKADVFGYITRMKRDGAALHSLVDGPFAAVALDRPGQHRRKLAKYGGLVGAGDVRLDNRAEVAAIAGISDEGLADLELVLAAVDRAGEGCIRRILGDFAFVCWDARAQKLLAVRDAFGVKPLYQRVATGLVLFASDVEPLHHEDAYDTDSIADYLRYGNVSGDATIWRDVHAVGAGGMVRYRGTMQTSEQYWSADEFIPADDGDEAENCFRFRELFEESLRIRIDEPAQTWAHLSGGLDSSSVVALANVVRGGVTNTVTVVDSLGDGDERTYSEAVVRMFGLRNEQIRDYWAWQDDGDAPPPTSHPSPLYPFFARDRRMAAIVRSNGGRVLLSGLGADHYLTGSLDYITDLAARGRIRDALSEVTAWSVATRRSFWSIGRRFLVNPFITRERLSVEAPPWVMQGPGLRNRISRFARGGRLAGRIVESIRELPSWFERWPFGGDIEMRYPFLYRPLVEHSLCLPARHRIRPNEHKWILRQAMRDVLPEHVRRRSTKGGIDERILWSLRQEKARLDVLLRDPILAQLGCIDADVLRRTVDDASHGIPVSNVQLFSALALETWLAVRHGVWPATANVSVTAA